MTKTLMGILTGAAVVVVWLQFGFGSLLLVLCGAALGGLTARYLVPLWPAITQWLTAGKDLFTKERQ
ncbi:hypothetical protein [Lacticaseibacillus thailandensis]|nr:hypothetical protein [Lacticaseibacillus thailandensis]